MARTLTDDDIEAIAERVVTLIAARLSFSPPVAALNPATAPPVQVVAAPPLAYTRKELAKELRLSPASIWRLEKRGLLKSVPCLRTKFYPRHEVERYLSGVEKRNR